MSPSDCLVIWTEQNDDIVRKWKCAERKHNANGQDVRRQYYNELCSLLHIVQGAPCVAASLELELTVLYNTLLFSLSLSKFGEAGDLLTQGIIRVLEAFGCQPPSSDLLLLWHEFLEKFQSPKLLPSTHALLCVQWTLWLSTQQLDSIQKLLLPDSQDGITSLSPVIQNIQVSPEENPSLLLIMAPMALKELAHICTVVTRGVGKMKEDKDSEAVQILQDASMLPAPTSLLAEIHMLTGICLARLGRPQSSLQCYRRALEMGACSRTVLYQGSLLHRQLENGPAEIEMLRLLCTAALSPVSCDPSSTWVPLLTPDMLLGGPACDSVFAMPSLLEIQHTLAHRCLHCGRISEAAENYLDLLATLQCDLKQLVNTDANSRLPRVPDIYLEAAVTLLKAERYWDSITVCEEVIMKTADLIPDRLVLEMPHRTEQDGGSLAPFSPEMRGLFAKSGKAEERLNYVFWAGAAFLIEGQAYGWMKESKGEITALTRSINLLVKVRLKNEEWQHRDPGDSAASKVADLQRLKALALASRGVGFMDRKQEGAALQDFQLSLQASPGTEVVELLLTQVLWKMGREEEATTFWKSTRRTSQVPELVPNCSRNAAVFLHLQSYLQEKMQADSESLKKMKLGSEAEV
ncbi:Fanconi anemia group G protein [Brienomyrus brachyistius]|uniref:Fanconi anemia group G protein n=1 Tax=Brienomyrus brachyistius TaxID=42636 RepID=UPI0020B328A7|nr:Fanconi anemia group G protein [Brienomyrus brachyistius]